MSERAKRLTWGAFLIALTVALAAAYRHFIWNAPEGAFRFTRNGQHF